jgi:hypothetical protein
MVACKRPSILAFLFAEQGNHNHGEMFKSKKSEDQDSNSNSFLPTICVWRSCNYNSHLLGNSLNSLVTIYCPICKEVFGNETRYPSCLTVWVHLQNLVMYLSLIGFSSVLLAYTEAIVVPTDCSKWRHLV